MTASEKPKPSLRRGISLRPRRHIELICPLPLKACHEKLYEILPGITTWNDSEDVVRFGYFSIVDSHEAARATGYLKALTDGTTLVSAQVSVVPRWLWVVFKNQLRYGLNYFWTAGCVAVMAVYMTLCVVSMIFQLRITITPDDITAATLLMVILTPVGIFVPGILMDYLILTRYRDDIITMIQDGFPAQPQPAKK